MKALKILNYILLLNSCCGFGYIITQLVWNWKIPSILIILETVVSMALFMVLVNFENKLKEKKEV